MMRKNLDNNPELQQLLKELKGVTKFHYQDKLILLSFIALDTSWKEAEREYFITDVVLSESNSINEGCIILKDYLSNEMKNHSHWCNPY